MDNQVDLSPASISIDWREYYQLTKPKVVMLLLLTALVGMFLAQPETPRFFLVMVSMIGIGFMSASAAVINQVVDRHIDVKMSRTANRPVVTGSIKPERAMLFACVLLIAGYAILAILVNQLTAVLTLASLVGYACIYTMYLKRATPQNIVIGGLAGAAPPLLGWTAMTGEIHPYGLLLVMIVFTWTPPHFWALAIHRRDEYAKANVPMLPVTHGIGYTKTSILLFTILLCVVCLLPYIVGMTGLVYLTGVSLLNVVFLFYALKLKYLPEPNTAIRTFVYSIWHLMLLFIVLLVDHYVGFVI